jgi:hypothetical protein
MLAIQIVTVQWSKRSRGGDAAAVRNRIARAFLLKSHAGSLNVIDRRGFAEDGAGGFVARVDSTGPAPQPPCNSDGLLLQMCDGHLLVGFEWDLHRHGMPRRERKRRAAVLRPGESAQLRVNGRHAHYHWYTQHTFNVAWGCGFDEDVFVGRAFDHVVSFEAHLF